MNAAEDWRYSHETHCVQDAHDLIVAFMPAARGEMFAIVNGPLIAAAPDLYAALKDVRDYMARNSLGSPGHLAEAALAKADGRS